MRAVTVFKNLTTSDIVNNFNPYIRILHIKSETVPALRGMTTGGTTIKPPTPCILLLHIWSEQKRG